MHFALIGPPLRGHLGPLCVLAKELNARGHRTTFVDHADAGPMVEAEGIRFEAIGSSGPPVSSWTNPMARIRGLLGLGGVIDGMVRFTDMFCREAPAVLQRIGADAVIADQLEPGGALVAEALGLPFVSIANALPMNRELGVPPPYVSWSYDPSPAGIKRNRGGWRVTDLLLRRLNKSIERNARSMGLPPRRRLEECFSPLLQIAQMVPSIDFPRAELPASFYYTGPFRGAASAIFEVPKDDSTPLIFCSLGTLQGSRTRLFAKVAGATASIGARLLLTHGGAANSDELRRLPGNPLVYDWVDQRAVLAGADVAVCHGGMNTVLDAIAAGVPLIVMPIAFEQSAIAARVQHAGVGLALPPRSSKRRLAAAIRRVREDPRFRKRAVTASREIALAGGAERAVTLIEDALRSRRHAPEAAATRAGAAPGDARGDSRSGSS